MRRSRYQRYAFLTAIVFLALIVSGCEQKTINEIKAEPSRYANREVAVAGTVVWSSSVMGRGAYEIEDGTGRLWVVSETGVPRKGARVVVKGTIRDAFDLSGFVNLPGTLSSGLVMIEKSHKAR
jgi:hypothetical protein